MATTRNRRRIDRVTSDDFLDGLAEADPAQLRAMRDDCREEEARLSYTRRLLQARLDIVRAEASRRSADEHQGDLVDRLPAILADRSGGGNENVADARAVAMYEPKDPAAGLRRTDDALLEDASLGRLPDMGEDEVLALAERLASSEAEVSALRGRVLSHLDALQAELIERYRSGNVAVDEILSEPRAPRG